MFLDYFTRGPVRRPYDLATAREVGGRHLPLEPTYAQDGFEIPSENIAGPLPQNSFSSQERRFLVPSDQRNPETTARLQILDLLIAHNWEELNKKLDCLLKQGTNIHWKEVFAGVWEQYPAVKEIEIQLIMARSRVVLTLCDEITAICTEGSLLGVQINVLLERFQLWPITSLTRLSLAEIDASLSKIRPHINQSNLEYMDEKHVIIQGEQFAVISESTGLKLGRAKSMITCAMKEEFCLRCVKRSEGYLYGIEKEITTPCSRGHGLFWLHDQWMPSRQKIFDPEAEDQQQPTIWDYLSPDSNSCMTDFAHEDAEDQQQLSIRDYLSPSCKPFMIDFAHEDAENDFTRKRQRRRCGYAMGFRKYGQLFDIPDGD
ncbi:hypothetical protein D8B26_003062 [Coccidioides posadasii str. Silveira]|uniref:Uncharacterized protein n=1 Tax=Coccidioides posadasii (strain RMSCC 757 / Silveira) TaxID=443226 RepID=E9CZE2_COCPS|nr:conserved hypothetical protein [Coccidioides posadasii str. Silveira]QVM08371.1 hypothetical protein D8B26_003062 [Coccidioides posadasii str. Silveira]